jgi:hypothetical protein
MGSTIGRLFASALAAGAVVAAASSAEASTVGFCNFSNAGQLQGVQLEGSAVTNSGVVGLTTDSTNQSGSAWLKTPVALTATTIVKTHFRFRMYFNSDATGGDGITFSMQNKSTTANSGGSLAVSGLSPAVSVEFDTNKDNQDDPNGNHVGVIVNGKTNQHLAYASPPFNMKNGNVTDVWVDYTPSDKKLRVYMAQNAPKPATALLTTSIDLYAATDAFGAGNTVIMGFTGSTSSEVNHQDVTYWVLTNDGTAPTDCIPCVNDNDCSVVPSTPACLPSTGFCAECSATNTSHCTGSTPVCDTNVGVCVECNTSSDCSGNTPVCDNHVCVACTGDYDGNPPPPDTCQAPAKPACQGAGQLQGACTQCSSTNATQCAFPRPVCITGSGAGSCGCNVDADCGGVSSGLICSGNICVAGCRPGADGGAGNGNGCDTSSGFACSVADGGTVGNCTKGCTSDGECNPPIGRCDLNTNKCVQCLSSADCQNNQICDLNKNLCGECTLGNVGNCDPGGVGGACLPNNTCGCTVDTDCAGGRVCDATSRICTTGCHNTTNGNTCQPGDVCVIEDGGIGQCVTNDGGLDAGNPDAGDGSAGDGGDAGNKDSGTGLDAGIVTTPDSGADSGKDGGLFDNFSIEGGGCACNVLGVGNGALSFGSVAVAGLAMLAMARRRRRQGSRRDD